MLMDVPHQPAIRRFGMEDDTGVLLDTFHEATKLTPYLITSQILSSRLHTMSERWVHAHAGNRKVYCDLPRIPLPPGTPCDAGLETALQHRVSERQFTGEALSLEQLGGLLVPALGRCRRVRHPADQDVESRLGAYPSGGALFPVEHYLLLLRVDGAAPAITHIDPFGCALVQLRTLAGTGDVQHAFTAIPHWLETVSVILVQTAVWRRSTVKYGARGYRLALLEAGHAAQNVLLTASALGIGSLAWAGYFDDRLHDLIEVDGVEESAVGCVMLGAVARPADDAGGQR